MFEMTTKFTLTVKGGRTITVHAAKPKSLHPADTHLFIVLRNSPSGSTLCPYVVHDYNALDGGFYNGRYCENLEEGMRIFNEAK